MPIIERVMSSKMNKLIKPVCLAAMFLSLAACQSTAPVESSGERSSKSGHADYDRSTEVAPIPQVDSSMQAPPAAVMSLLQLAKQQQQRQQWQQSIETAERGLRIERRMAELYLVLSDGYSALQQRSRAKSFAQQGLRYAQPNSRVYKLLQELLR